MIRAFLAGLAFAFAVSAWGDEKTVRRVVADKLGDAEIVSVRKLPKGGLFEVALRGPRGIQVIYTDAAASVLLIGNLLDVASGQNLTEARVRALSRIDWKALPFQWALTSKRGNGKREIAVFSDPNCPYCERFERGLMGLTDITVHIFMFPVIRPDSVRQSKAVWCSSDRVKAWNDLMLFRVEPVAKPDCDTPVEKLVALGRELGASSTPTWFLRDGELRKGAVTMADLEPLLDEATAKVAREGAR